LNSQTTTTKVGGSNSKQSGSFVFDTPTQEGNNNSPSILGNDYAGLPALTDITELALDPLKIHHKL